LLANLSRTLAGEGKPQATTLAGSALDAIRAIADTVRRDSALQEIVRLLAPSADAPLVLETISVVVDVETKDDVSASAAEAFARRGDAATASAMLERMHSTSRRSNAIDPVAAELFSAKQYDAGRGLYELLSTPPNFKRSYGTAQAAAALARDGDHAQAA